MSVQFEYPNKFTFSKINTKTESDRPYVRGLENYIFRIKNSFMGIDIDPKTGVILIGSKAVPGNYILEIDCIDSLTNKMYSTKHVVFVRDPEIKFPGDDDFTEDCEFKSSKLTENVLKRSHKNNKYIKQKHLKNGSVSDKKNINVWLVSIIFTILLTIFKMIS